MLPLEDQILIWKMPSVLCGSLVDSLVAILYNVFFFLFYRPFIM
jgi:hypothetical protein